MRILFGVQATGNGHISRARVLAPLLRDVGAEVTWLFSGRARSQLFDMQVFGEYLHRTGLTFVHRGGRIRHAQTLLSNPPLRFLRDCIRLRADRYDVVITDFEPVTAWSARIRGLPCIGIGHQYAFHYRIPVEGDHLVARAILRHYAPATIRLGLHWHHFGQPILPPIIEVFDPRSPTDPHKILVYMYFEDVDEVLRMIHPFRHHRFHVYAPTVARCFETANAIVKPLSREGFTHDLQDCAGVICNSGFELVSEAIHLGKRILVKPLGGQMEQRSNARALTQLNLGRVMERLSSAVVESWLAEENAVRVRYPSVAPVIVDWLMAGDWTNVHHLADRLWQGVELTPRGPTPQHRVIAATAR